MKNKQMFLLMVVAALLLAGCKWCPAGDPGDYKDVETNSPANGYYQLASGKGYHGTGYLSRNSLYGSGGTYYFQNGESDLHCLFSSKKFHDGTVTVFVNSKSYSNPENFNFDVPAKATVQVSWKSRYYIASGNKKEKAFEFYLWCE